MKIELTKEQRQQMKSIFKAMDVLKKDKQFIKLLEHCCDEDFDEMKEVNSTNEDDYMRIINFYDDITDRAEDFNYHNY
jgi:Spy/CpxP family protein refolding chaperone